MTSPDIGGIAAHYLKAEGWIINITFFTCRHFDFKYCFI